MSKRLSQEEFIERLAIVNPDIIVLGTYAGQKSAVLTKCRKCGFEWHPRAGNLLYRKSGCPECKKETISKALRKTHDTFLKELSIVNPEISVLEQYHRDGSRIEVRCDICKHEWKATPNHLLQGHGCPKCSHTSTSFMEQYLFNAMTLAFGNDRIRSRNKTLIGTELDIVIDLDGEITAIEIGSWRFHKKTVARDKKKIEQCRNMGITFWAILDQYDEAQQPYDCNCLTYPFCLGAEPKHRTLREITKMLLSEMGRDDLTSSEYTAVEELAVNNSRRLSTEDFKKEMSELLPNVTVLGEYVRSDEGIKCKCNDCGTVWYPTPANIRQGHGCRVCSSRESGLRQRLSRDEYEAKLKALNPHLSLVGNYDGSQNPVTIHCDLHDVTWTAPNAHRLTSRKNCGCAKCKSEAISKRWKKPHDQYVQDLADRNPNIEVLGKYEGSSKPIKVRCLDCQHIWEPKAGDLLQGRSCPTCWEKRRGSTLRWTQERFDEELRRAHPDIVRLTEYKGANQRIKVKCLHCGEVWEPKANYLVTRSKGCPNRDNH